MANKPPGYPTREEIARIGKEASIALEPLKLRHEGFEFALVLSVPRVGSDGKHATCTVTSLSAEYGHLLLTQGAAELDEQLLSRRRS